MDQHKNLLSKLSGVRQSGPGKWLARCPAHEDRSPSLAIKLTDDALILVHCFGGCSVEDVLAAVGLTMVDLFPERPPSLAPDGSRKPIPRFRADELIQLAAFEASLVAYAAGDVLAGKPLAGTDYQRLLQARDTLHAIIEEVRHV